MARYWSQGTILFSTQLDAETEKIQESTFSYRQPTTSLVGVSDLHMNRNRSFNSVQVQEGQAQNSSTHIKNINMIANITKQKKMSHSFTQTKMFPIWSDINICFGSVFNYDQSYIWLCNLLLPKSGSEWPGDFYKSVAIKCHVQEAGYAGTDWSTVN